MREIIMRFLFISNYGKETFTSFQYILIHALEKESHIIDHLYPKDGPILTQIKNKKISPPDAILYMEGLLFQDPKWLKLPFRIPKIWWFLDTPVLFEQQVNWYQITEADTALVRDRREIPRFEERGLKCVWVYPRIDPNIFHPHSNLSRDIDIGFVGYINKSRAKWLEKFIQITPKVHAYGDGEVLPFKPLFNCNICPEKLPHEDVAKIYSRTRICPHQTGRYEGSGTVAVGIQGDITWRPFEASACGAMVLTEEFDAVDELWVGGREIVVHKTGDDKEMLDLAKYYLEHEEERAKIADAGYKRTIKDHTWKSAIEQIIKIVEKLK